VWIVTKLAGMIYGSTRNENGMTREAIETAMNEGVFAANGMRKILVKFARSRMMYRAGFGRNPSGLANLLIKCECLEYI
jgi:hypothetical protein